jgi:hypothetical protein
VWKESRVLRQIAIAALFAVPAALAWAQDVRDIEPVWKVVTRDGVSMRCGPESVFYAVAEYSTGRLLLVDGLTDSQARVRYPDDLAALVPADEVKVINDRSVELIRPSGLRAPSELLGLSGSWKALFDPTLPAGTQLAVRDTVKNTRGEVVGYAVIAPKPPAVTGHARAFVPADALRDATPDEIAKHLGTAPAKPAATPAGTPAAQPGTQPAAQPATQPADAAGQPQQPDEGTSVVLTPGAAVPVDPAGQPVTQPATTPAAATPAQTETPAQPVAQPAADPRQIFASKLEDLEASFAAARKLPAEQLDVALDELLAEYSRTREETTDDEYLAAQLDQRIEWLNLRILTRDQRRSIQAAMAQADDRSKALDNQVVDWRKGRAYQLVGRLVQSTVYNGERLPRMFRVQSVTSFDGTPRTLGYLVPDATNETKLGAIVGIVGEARFDPQLRLMVIKADQVDVMPE